MHNKLRKLVKYFTMFAFMLNYSIGFADESTENISLQQCLEVGLKKNISIINSELDQKKSEMRINEARSSGLPQIEASIQTLDYLKKSVMLLPGELMGQPGSNISLEIGSKYVTTASIKFNQLLYSQTYFLALDVSKRYAKLSEINVEKIKNDVIIDLTKMYVLASITNQQIEIIKTNIARLDTIINITNIALTNGFAQKVDIDRAEMNKSELSAQLEITKTLYRQQNDLIKYYIDYPSDLSITYKIESLFNSPDHKIDSTDVLQRKELQLLVLQTDLYKDNVKAIQYEYIPTLSFIGSFQYQNMREDYKLIGTKWYGNSYIGLNVSIPIFDGLNKDSRIEQAQIELLKSENTKRDTKNYFMVEFEQSKREYEKCNNTLSVRNENVSLAHKILDITKVKYSEGQFAMKDLLADEIALSNSELNLLSAKMDLLYSELGILKSTNKLEILLNK